MALDPATGNSFWSTPRPVPNSWGTPVVAPTESGPQIITCGDPWVIAYDPQTGRELWRANALARAAAPSPPCSAARSGQLLWDHWFDCAFWASPSIVGDLVYLPGEDGKVYFVKLASEYELVGEANMGEPLYASPAFVDSRIYIRTSKHLLCIGKVGSVAIG